MDTARYLKYPGRTNIHSITHNTDMRMTFEYKPPSVDYIIVDTKKTFLFFFFFFFDKEKNLSSLWVSFLKYNSKTKVQNTTFVSHSNLHYSYTRKTPTVYVLVSYLFIVGPKLGKRRRVAIG